MEKLANGHTPGTELLAISVAIPALDTVLLVSNDGGLQYSRRMLLERASLGVLCLNSSQALKAVHLVCDVALLCRSVSLADAERIAQSLHLEEGNTPVLRFGRGGEMPSKDFTAVLPYSLSPPMFVAEVEALLRTRPRAARGLSRETIA